jgi:hypothetical protein
VTESAGARPADGPALPDDLAWLDALVARSPLLPDARLRRHWRTVLPWLSTPARYKLAASLRSVEQALAQRCD